MRAAPTIAAGHAPWEAGQQKEEVRTVTNYYTWWNTTEYRWTERATTHPRPQDACCRPGANGGLTTTPSRPMSPYRASPKPPPWSLHLPKHPCKVICFFCCADSHYIHYNQCESCHYRRQNPMKIWDMNVLIFFLFLILIMQIIFLITNIAVDPLVRGRHINCKKYFI